MNFFRKQKSNYDELLNKIPISPNTVFEIGMKDGLDTVLLSKRFKNSKIYCYEANPLNDKLIKKNLRFRRNVFYENYGLGETEGKKTFFVYTPNKVFNYETIGASSFFNRPDEENITELEDIQISTLYKEILEKEINTIDILLMDVQGYELNILKGAKEFISKISYIIMETPKPEEVKLKNSVENNLEINDYIGAPSYSEVNSFMTQHNFSLIDSVDENLWETNNLYKNNIL